MLTWNLSKTALLAAAFLTATATAGCSSDPSSDPGDVTSGSMAQFTSDAAGFDTHSYYYDTGKEVVVFDAQFTVELAEALIADIKAHTASPIKYVVISHPNPDKFNGAPAFQAMGAKVVASEATASAIPGVHEYKKYYFVEVAKSFTEATYPAEAKVDITWSGDFSLPLEGGAKVELHELTNPGVSTTQSVAYIEAEDALVVGDLVHYKAHAWLEGGIREGKADPDLGAWKLALDELMAFEGATVLGGRGESATVSEAVAEQKAYLDGASKIVGDYVTGLGANTSELFGEKAGEHYAKIGDQFAAAYPDYELRYMIDYGVYGLVNEVAAGATK
jgi:glyoxylase-like metal-dependent hydrolase (beta-lactamase superfamily II)